MTLTERFLRAKHWQLFLLLFGVPFLIQIITMGVMTGTMMASMGSGQQPNPSAFMGPFFILFVLLMVILSATLFGWLWSLGIGLQEKIPPAAKMKTRMFKVCFFFGLVYISLFAVGIAVTMVGLSSMIETHVQPDPTFIFGSFAIIFPLHIFAMFCMFYCLYFVSKTFKTAELQRATTFSDYAGEFFLFWFYPIGIWIVQPKINQMAGG